MERNKSSCDRRPTCPTALLLVLHVTKSQVAIPHIYKFLLGVSRSRSPKPFLLHSVHSYFPPSLTFFISVYFPLFPSFPSYSVVVSFPHTFCIQRPFGCSRSFCLLNLLAVVGHKLNTERKCVGGVHAHAWLLLGLLPSLPRLLHLEVV